MNGSRNNRVLANTLSASPVGNLCLLNSVWLGISTVCQIKPDIGEYLKLYRIFMERQHDGRPLDIDMVSSYVAENADWDSDGLRIRNLLKMLGGLFDITIVVYDITGGVDDGHFFFCRERLKINPGCGKKVMIATNMLHFYLILETFKMGESIEPEHCIDGSRDMKALRDDFSRMIGQWNITLETEYTDFNPKKDEEQIRNDYLVALKLATE